MRAVKGGRTNTDTVRALGSKSDDVCATETREREERKCEERPGTETAKQRTDHRRGIGRGRGSGRGHFLSLLNYLPSVGSDSIHLFIRLLTLKNKKNYDDVAEADGQTYVLPFMLRLRSLHGTAALLTLACHGHTISTPRAAENVR